MGRHRFRIRPVSLAIFGVVALAAPAAIALVTEPNGLVVPRDSANGEVQLYTFFQQQGEPIQWQQDAHTTPDVFSPLCSFSATFLLHQAGGWVGLGWYNVDPNASSPPTQIYVVAPAGTQPGTTITSSQIVGDPNYAGGLVGFAIVGMQTHYSEQKWNPVCTSCSPAGPWATAVMYKSINVPNSYYLAFEDGQVSASSFNNDGDFNDDVYLLTGLVCAGGGQPCDTGQPGVCSAGLTDCDASGQTTCKQANQAGTEVCDGFDNDCNGQVDDGDLCPSGEICYHGHCVGKCGTGEFACSGGMVCQNGYCVDPACASVTCPSGQVCVAGVCKAPCEGVICPAPQQCQLGVCVDPCAQVTCPAGQVCNSGVCVTGCNCSVCPGGTTCDSADLECKDPACVGVSCNAGLVCQGGSCVDACTGAVCPSGQTCQGGQCVDVQNDGGSTAGSGGQFTIDAGLGGTGKGGSGGSAAGVSAPGGVTPTSDSGGGCGCRTAPSQGTFGQWLAALALFAFGFARRRRARRTARVAEQF